MGVKKNKANKYYVHVYFDPTLNAPFYVGKGKGYRYRAGDHLLDRGNFNSFVKNKLRKIGVKNVIIEFALKNVCEECAFCCEIDLIATIGRRDLGKGPLCNLTNGGDGAVGYIHTEESKQKMSKSQKGRIVSDETRQKISKVQKGKLSIRYGKPSIFKGKHHAKGAKQKMRESSKGQVPWNKGKKMSKAARRNMSEAAKRRWRNR